MGLNSCTNMMSQREVEDYERNVLGVVRSSDLGNGSIPNNNANTSTGQRINNNEHNKYNEDGIVTTKMGKDNPYLSKLKQMIYYNRTDSKNKSQCHPIQDKDYTSMLNTGVTRNQKDTSSSHTYNNSLFNNNFNVFTHTNMPNPIINNNSYNKDTIKERDESINNDVVSCSFYLSVQEMVVILSILII